MVTLRRLSRSALAAVLVATGAFVLLPPPASACSCGAPAPGAPSPAVVVEGVAGEQRSDTRAGNGDSRAQMSSWAVSWEFVVDRVERGPLESGDRIEVHIMEGSGAGCGVSVGPVDRGRAYRVGGSYDETTRGLHLNLCSSPILEPLGDAPAEEPTSSPDAGSAGEGDSATPPTFLVEAPVGSAGLGRPLAAAGVGTATAAAAGLFLVWRRTRAGTGTLPTDGSG